MDPTFVFIMFLVLLVFFVTVRDVLKWTSFFRVRRKPQKKEPRMAPPVFAGSLDDRKKQ